MLSPFELGVADVGAATEAVIFGIVGLSLNVLLGYAGQISLGHQAFVGIGAFTSAYVVVDLQLSFWFALADRLRASARCRPGCSARCRCG